MKRIMVIRVSLLFALVASFAALAWGQGGYKTESIGALNSPDVSKTLADALEPQGTRLVDDKGAPVSEVWLLKSVALAAAGGSSDAVYPGLTAGELVGVLHFPSQGSDFRGQPIKPGYYTLRYARMPQDGNHMGVNPYPDFLLLSPVAADTQLGPVAKVDDLVKLSKQASGTAHPAILSMIPVSQGAAFPSVAQDDQGHWALQVKLGGGSLPIALILVGQVTAS
jgi:hypothetical protein